MEMENTPLQPIENFNSLLELMDYFKEETVCLKYLEYWCWRGCPQCPYCAHDKIYRFKDGVRFKCALCRKQFTAKIGTIFEDSNLPMRKWFAAIYLLTAHKKGISSHQLARDLSITQKSAWFVLHRIRFGMGNEHTEHPDNNMDNEFSGIVQVDESFVGGKNKNRHANKKTKHAQGRAFIDKTPVMGMLRQRVIETVLRPNKVEPHKRVEETKVIRESHVKLVVTHDTNKESLLPPIYLNIEKNATVVTDEWYAYGLLSDRYYHKEVDHTKHEYVSPQGYTTNAVESLWTWLKRSYVGIYHYMSRKHLQRYADEVGFRYNTRNMKQGERIGIALSYFNCRMTYKQLIGKTS